MNARYTLFGLAAVVVTLVGCAGSPPQEYRPRLSSLDESAITDADIAAEIEFGRRVSAAIVGRYDGIDNEPVQRYVNLVGSTLAEHSRRPELDFHFYVLESSQVNAYAAPGGYVFVTSAALERMRDEAELAAVLAHEIAHIDQRHIVGALNIEATDSSAGLSQLMGGGTETTRVVFSQAVDQALDILFEQGLLPADELAADNQAVFMLTSAGYDPQALSRYLTRIRGERVEAIEEVQGTHPPFDQRLGALQALMRDNGLDGLVQPRMTARFSEQR